MKKALLLFIFCISFSVVSQEIKREIIKGKIINTASMAAKQGTVSDEQFNHWAHADLETDTKQSQVPKKAA